MKSKNPNSHAANTQQSDHKVCYGSSRDGRVNFDLDSYSESDLKQLKHRFVSDIQSIRSFVKQIEARGLNFDKSGKIMTRQKHIMHNRENKRKRTKIMDSNSTESRKIEAAMMRKCNVILDNLMKHRHGWVFLKPVDVVALRIPDYNEVVKHPMDLGTIKSNLEKRVYGSPVEFAKDVRLTFDNALLYNREGEDVHNMAVVLLEMFNKLFDPAYEKYVVELEKFGKAMSDSKQDDGEEGAENSVLKKQGTVLEGEENAPKRREMTDAERVQVGHAVEDLAGKYLDEILQIVAKRNYEMTIPDADDEVELNVQAIDSETLWELDEFVRLKGWTNNKAM